MIMNKSEAINYVMNKGMWPVGKSSFADQDRVYFAYGENDVFFDHSATITKIGNNEYAVADFSHKRKV
jgi:hypothetical protein